MNIYNDILSTIIGECIILMYPSSNWYNNRILWQLWITRIIIWSWKCKLNNSIHVGIKPHRSWFRTCYICVKILSNVTLKYMLIKKTTILFKSFNENYINSATKIVTFVSFLKSTYIMHFVIHYTYFHPVVFVVIFCSWKSAFAVVQFVLRSARHRYSLA